MTGTAAARARTLGSGRTNDASRPAAVEHDASPQALRDASLAATDDASRPGGTRRICAWCKGPIPERARRDAVCCSVRCRRVRHRFLRAVGWAEAVAYGHGTRPEPR